MIDYEKQGRILVEEIYSNEWNRPAVNIEKMLRAIAAEARKEALEEASRACLEAHAKWSLKVNSYACLMAGFDAVAECRKGIVAMTISDVPRRCYIDKMVPAEKAILDAIVTVEALGCDERLTRAIILLGQARELVADVVDSKLAEESGK